MKGQIKEIWDRDRLSNYFKKEADYTLNLKYDKFIEIIKVVLKDRLAVEIEQKAPEEEKQKMAHTKPEKKTEREPAKKTEKEPEKKTEKEPVKEPKIKPSDDEEASQVEISED